MGHEDRGLVAGTRREHVRIRGVQGDGVNSLDRVDMDRVVVLTGRSPWGSLTPVDRSGASKAEASHGFHSTRTRNETRNGAKYHHAIRAWLPADRAEVRRAGDKGTRHRVSRRDAKREEPTLEEQNTPVIYVVRNDAPLGS